jgi:hypothetical protein
LRYRRCSPQLDDLCPRPVDAVFLRREACCEQLADPVDVGEVVADDTLGSVPQKLGHRGLVLAAVMPPEKARVAVLEQAFTTVAAPLSPRICQNAPLTRSARRVCSSC